MMQQKRPLIRLLRVNKMLRLKPLRNLRLQVCWYLLSMNCRREKDFCTPREALLRKQTKCCDWRTDCVSSSLQGKAVRRKRNQAEELRHEAARWSSGSRPSTSSSNTSSSRLLNTTSWCLEELRRRSSAGRHRDLLLSQSPPPEGQAAPPATHS